MKKAVLLIIPILILVMGFGVTGCSEKISLNEEMVPKIIDKTVEVTEKAIEEKNLKMARHVWSEISEYGVKAKEMGKEELAENLGRLASTYVYLIDYIQSGDESKLDQFRNEFQTALEPIRSYGEDNTEDNSILE